MVLAARLAIDFRADWLAAAALAVFVFGLCIYAVVLARFDLRQMLVGRGDQWVCGGALAISTLACARCSQAAAVVGWGSLSGLLDHLAALLWIVAVAWLPALVAAEVFRPRGWGGFGRWATVFPLGMYAVCSFATGSAESIHAVYLAGEVAVWLALAAWVIVAAGTVRMFSDRLRTALW